VTTMQAFIAAFRDVAAYLWRAVDAKEALAASEEVAMDTGTLLPPKCTLLCFPCLQPIPASESLHGDEMRMWRRR
jgi:hypothetical protein